MENNKIISMDFDGTLLTSDKKITEKTKSILKRCRDNNYIIIGITARNLASAKDVLDINIQLFDYIILNNGAFLLNVKTGDVTSYGTISNSDLRKIESVFKNTNAKCEYVSLNKYYMIGVHDPKGIRVNINSTSEIDEEIARMNVYLETEEELNYYKNVILENIKTVNVVSMKDTDNKNTKLWLTINEKGTNKLIALTKILKKISVSLNQVIFFGDGENDLSLLENVGMGVAMGNAIDEVKNRSKAITLSNNEDGIYIYLTNNLIFKQ